MLNHPIAHDPLAALTLPVDGPVEYRTVRLHRKVYEVLLLLQAHLTMARGRKPSMSDALATGLLESAPKVFAEGVVREEEDE